MNFARTLLAVGMVVYAGNVRADEAFARHKQRILEALDQRAEAIRLEKECIAKAESKEALRDCHGKIVEMRREHRSKRRQELHDDMEGLLKGTQRR